MKWEPINTAPKALGLPMKKILLRFGSAGVAIAYWDEYYAEGGYGCTDGFAWIEPHSSEPLNRHYSEEPDGWMELPPARGQIEEPKQSGGDEVEAASTSASLTHQLLKRAAEKLHSVEKDTEYLIHEPETPRSLCGCILCDLDKHLGVANDT